MGPRPIRRVCQGQAGHPSPPTPTPVFAALFVVVAVASVVLRVALGRRLLRVRPPLGGSATRCRPGGPTGAGAGAGVRAISGSGRPLVRGSRARGGVLRGGNGGRSSPAPGPRRDRKPGSERVQALTAARKTAGSYTCEGVLRRSVAVECGRLPRPLCDSL